MECLDDSVFWSLALFPPCWAGCLFSRVWLWSVGVHTVCLRHVLNWVIVLLNTQSRQQELGPGWCFGPVTIARKRLWPGVLGDVLTLNNTIERILLNLINTSVSRLLSVCRDEISTVCRLSDVRVLLHFVVCLSLLPSTFRRDSKSKEIIEPVLFAHDKQNCIMQHRRRKGGRGKESWRPSRRRPQVTVCLHVHQVSCWSAACLNLLNSFKVYVPSQISAFALDPSRYELFTAILSTLFLVEW